MEKYWPNGVFSHIIWAFEYSGSSVIELEGLVEGISLFSGNEWIFVQVIDSS